MEKYNDDAHPDLTEEKLKEFLNSSEAPLTDKIPLESISNVFKVPENPQYTYGNFGEKFERYKVRIDLFKWLIGTVGLTIITFIINWGFRDREQGMNEISQYDKYATELIVLNDNPVNRRMLAQYFSKVTPSEKLRCGWEDYYKEVDKEYQIFLQKDSLIKLQLKNIDTTNLSAFKKMEIENLVEKSAEFDRIKSAPIITPTISASSTQSVYIQSISASKESAESIKATLSLLGFKVPPIEYMNKNKYSIKTNEIRYFREVDYPSVVQIQTSLQSINVSLEIKYMPSLSSKTQVGTIELWLQ